MAAFRNLAIGVLKTLGADNIAKPPGQSATHQNGLPVLGLTTNPDLSGT